jgi:hypothetical protein
MKYLILILTTLLLGAGLADKKKSIKVKREYEYVTTDNGAKEKKHKSTITYSASRQVISETRECGDPTCCKGFNKVFTLFDSKNEYYYKGDKMILRVFRTCDTLPCYKHRFEYKYDDKKRLVEERELTYTVETDTKRYHEGKWIPANIGDSTLTKIEIQQYVYNEFDSIKEKKFIIQDKYPSVDERSWTVKLKYDEKKRRIEEDHGTFKRIKLKAKWFYDENGRLFKTESNLALDKVSTEVTFDKFGNVSTKKWQLNDSFTVTKFEYNADNLNTIARQEGNRIKSKTIKYYYNDNKDLIRTAELTDNDETPIVEYEYEYHQE